MPHKIQYLLPWIGGKSLTRSYHDKLLILLLLSPTSVYPVSWYHFLALGGAVQVYAQQAMQSPGLCELLLLGGARMGTMNAELRQLLMLRR